MWLYLLCWCLGTSTAFQCNSHESTPLKMSISSRTNLTGHSIAQVQLLHDGALQDLGSWDVEIEHKTANCGDLEPVLIVATVTAPPRRLFGYVLKSGLGYYKMHTEGKTWHGARDTCFEEGGNLLIINSEREAAVVRNIWRMYPKLHDDWRNSCSYIGIHDENEEGNFITVFGDSLNSTGYTKWHKDEPGEGTSDNCGCVDRSGLIAGTSCYNELAYICEQPVL